MLKFEILISYTIFGKGDPILLLNGYSLSKNEWDLTFLKELSENHTMIVFDNPSIGNLPLVPKTLELNNLL